MRMSIQVKKLQQHTFWCVLLAVLTICGMANAEDLTISSVFTDHMILQRDKAIKVWGWADVGESVTVTFNGKSKTATADANSRWEVALVSETASKTSRNFTVQGASSTITLTDVLVGDVWLCSGQSNISGAAIQSSANRAGGMIRNLRTVSGLAADWQNVQKNVEVEYGGWISDGYITTVGFHFAETVYESLGSTVPIGLIDSSVSGKSIESYLPPMDQATWEAKVPADMRALPKTWSRAAGGYWNCLVAPYAGVSVRGAIWYQGEENAKFGEYQQYAYKMWAMVKGWRDAWGQGDFTFVETQLCAATAIIPNDSLILSYDEIIALRDNLTAQTPTDYYRFATIREAQEMACGITDNMHMVVIADLGSNAESVDVHISLHAQAGQRIARVALNKEYGQTSILCDGPTYSSHVTEGNTVRVSFNNVGAGLITQFVPTTPAGSVNNNNGVGSDTDVYGFHIQGNDGAWHIADATLDASNNTVIVSKAGVISPINVRYSFETNPYKCNVYAKNGGPLVQFKTDGEGSIPSVTVNPTSGLETTEAGGTDTFTVVLDTAPTANVTIGLSSSDTTEGTVSPTSLTFTSANWSTPQTVTVTGVDDGVVDGWIDYNIVTAATSSSDGAYNGLTVADVGVKNQDDEVGTSGITVNPTTGLITTEAGGTDTFTVVLDAAPTADVTISLTSSDTTEGTVSPASLTFTTANWSNLQTVTVTGVDDADLDGDVAYTITTGDAASADGNYSGMVVDDVSVTNENDDVPDTVAPAQIYGLNAQIGGAAAKLTPASASATSNYNPDYLPDNAIDGDGGTLWVSGSQAEAGIAQSITLDLGASKQINKVRLQAPISGDAWNYGNFPSDFTVEVSTDNTNWTTIVTETGYTPTSGSWYEKTFANQDAQYVRFVADTTQVNTWSIYTIRLAEFEVYAPATTDQVSLTWTAVGDDENTGTATTYDLRYSTTGPIDTDTKWDAATVVPGLPAPQAPESAEIFLIPISTFTAGDTVHFCIKTADEVPNWSLRSNTDASVLIPNNITTYALTVNNGTGDGDYTAETAVLITADAAPANQHFDNWTTSNGGTFASATSATTTFTMPANAVTVTANFADDTPPAAVTDLDALLSTMSATKLSPTEITASSELGVDYIPNNVNDGDPATAWSSDLSTTGSRIEYITLDLGAPTMLNSVRLLPPSVDTSLFPSDFSIEVSLNNVDWTVAATESGYTPQASVWYEKDILAQAQYVRVIGNSMVLPANNFYYMRIAEFEAYDSAQQVELTWTAPGNSGNTGTAASYEIKYSTTGEINTQAKWDAAQDMTGEPAPQAAGSAETFSVPVTMFNTGDTVYFALLTYNSGGDVSPLSNSPFVTISADEPPAAVALAASFALQPSDDKQTPIEASASSILGSLYTADKIIDGDTSTMWQPDMNTSASQTEYITLDLGSSKEVGRVRLAPANTHLEVFPADFRIEVSEDNTTWVEVAAETGYTAQADVWYEKSFDAVTARYVRVIGETMVLAANGFYYMAISEFDIYAPGEPQVALTWTAPGENGNVGLATSYEIKYSTTGAISSQTEWDAAQALTGEPTPQMAGSAETFGIPITMFNPGDSVYFALITYDAAGNASTISNSPFVTIPADTYALTVTSGSGDNDYAAGTAVTIIADAAPAGQHFENWTTSNGGTFASATSATTTFTMPANAVTVTANYADGDTPHSADTSLDWSISQTEVGNFITAYNNNNNAVPDGAGDLTSGRITMREVLRVIYLYNGGGAYKGATGTVDNYDLDGVAGGDAGAPPPAESKENNTLVCANSADSGTGSLRNAIANSVAGDTIIFDESVEKITLVSEIVIDKSITIDGNGITIISGNAETRIFQICNEDEDIFVLLLNMGIVEGKNTIDEFGGAIYNNGENLTMENCLLNGNANIAENGKGGALYTSGTVNINNCVFTDNSAEEENNIYSTNDAVNNN